MININDLSLLKSRSIKSDIHGKDKISHNLLINGRKNITDMKFLPKSMPSETFPLATDNSTAPLPFSQAYNVI